MASNMNLKSFCTEHVKDNLYAAESAMSEKDRDTARAIIVALREYLNTHKENCGDVNISRIEALETSLGIRQPSISGGRRKTRRRKSKSKRTRRR
jgi:hypothetical protein